MHDDALKVAEYCHRVLPLHSASLSDEYYYQSLPLCIIDAVFSINVKYQSTQNVVSRYCQHFGLRKFRRDRTSMPSREEQESVSSLCERYIERGFGVMTEEILNNRQRTSAVNGITKAEAVLEFAATLKKYRIEYFQDIPTAMKNDDLEADIRTIPGQSSGISLGYFWMLAGSDEYTKPDRMVLGFLRDALGRNVPVTDAQSLMSAATDHIRTSLPEMTVRLLDYEIWKYQREFGATRGHRCG
ncbi:hypothetical protein [Cupriavidus necator]